jgi:GR25 family glycosyltransferase involved in LPS biosynthesis
MLKTYVISLEYPTQLMETLPQQGLLPVWSPGVNGKALTQKEIEENTTPLCAKICTLPSIGIGLAHINAWASILKNHDDYALIVEDDVIFVDDFNMQLTRALQHVPKDFDILYLGCFGCVSDTNIFSAIGTAGGYISIRDKHTHINSYIDRPSTVVATHAYIVSKKGASILLTNLQGKITGHIDYSIQALISDNKLDVYVTNPRIAFQTSTCSEKSTNTSKIHPYLLQYAVDDIYLDTAFSAKYFMTATSFNLFGFPLTPNAFLILLIGIILAFFRISPILLTILFLVISIPDFIYDSNVLSIIVHYALFIVPTLIVLGIRRVRG